MDLARVAQRGALFVDAAGGQMTLRGVNLGGDCKVPWPDGGTDRPGDFSDHREVSFIGRPFALEEADEHLGRLAHWGFNALRLLTTWEAVEHAGPGLYDEAYLDYFAQVARRAGDHGLHLFVDFHQDAWARMSGGDGAPGWTFDAVGLDFTRFAAAGAAHVMQARYDYDDPAPRQAAYPPMSWGSNYRLPANGIMWTLFWGGRLFTPDFRVGGENVQDFLQGHYLRAMGEVARRLVDLPNVLGFDTLNEPGLGWMGESLNHRHLAPTAERPERPRVGPALSPLDCLALARGATATVPFLERDRRGIAAPVGEVTLNAGRVSIWKADARCPFEAAGAYRMEAGAPRGLDEDFFRVAGGRTLSMAADAFSPFFQQVAATIRQHQPGWSVFVELDPFARSAGRAFPPNLPERGVNASHWYDPAILYRKRFDPADHYCVGTGEPERDLGVIAERFAREMGELASQAGAFPGGAPTLIGEFGIPFDLEEGEAYRAWATGRREGVWDRHEAALGAMYDAIDRHALHSTLWNYTASNRNHGRIGDGWNQEDLSIFSRDQQVNPGDLDDGGRAVAGFCRPFAPRVQGRLIGARFERAPARFSLDFTADPGIGGATEVYAPRVHFPLGFVARLEGVPAIVERSDQRLNVRALGSGPARLTLEAIRPD